MCMAYAHIYQTGEHAPAIDAAALRQIVADYNPDHHKAPLVIGHPKTNAPAFGWVDDLRVTKDGNGLEARFSDVSADFQEAARGGHYKKISASFYLRPHADGATTYSLRHVGVLGGQPPAVKGLREYSFADDGKDVLAGELDFDEARLAAFEGGVAQLGHGDAPVAHLVSRLVNFFERMTNLNTDNQGDTKMSDEPKGAATQTDKTPDPTAQDFAEREAALQQREAEIAKQEAALAASAAAAAKQDAQDFAEGLVQAGKILPRHKETIIEVLCGVPAESMVNFAEAGDVKEVALADALRAFLDDFPPQVEFKEIAKAQKDTPTSRTRVPAGYEVDADAAALADQVATYAAEKNVSFAEATQQVMAQNNMKGQ